MYNTCISHSIGFAGKSPRQTTDVKVVPPPSAADRSGGSTKAPGNKCWQTVGANTYEKAGL